MKSLFESLNLSPNESGKDATSATDAVPRGSAENRTPLSTLPEPEVVFPDGPPEKSPKQFCEDIINSTEFRKYLLNGIVLGDLAPVIVCRIMDHAWGKPVERIGIKDETDRIEDLSPEMVEQRLERVQRLLSLIRLSRSQTEQNDETVMVERTVH